MSSKNSYIFSEKQKQDWYFKKDTLFCSVRKEKILNAKPKLDEKVVREWFFHQRERTAIYRKKEIENLPPPWSDDPILSQYKFVNTKRKWDRQTKWLLENVIEKQGISYENKILNSLLFRVINKWETLDLLGSVIDFETLTLKKIDVIFRNILENKAKQNPEYVFFSAAYILWWPKVNFWKYIQKREKKTEKNMILRMIKFVYYHKKELLTGILQAKSQVEVYTHLCSFSGIWKFLAYQIFVDLTYIKDFPFTEHHFVISGPGCERGINWIFIDRDGMTSEECLFWFTMNQHKIAKKYGEYWDTQEIFSFLPESERMYTLMDMENSWACEIDKRCRTLFAGKRPKQRYKKTI